MTSKVYYVVIRITDASRRSLRQRAQWVAEICAIDNAHN